MFTDIEKEVAQDRQARRFSEDFIQQFLLKLKIADIPKGNKPGDKAINLVHEIINRSNLKDIYFILEDIAQDWGLFDAICASTERRFSNNEPLLTCSYIKKRF